MAGETWLEVGACIGFDPTHYVPLLLEMAPTFRAMSKSSAAHRGVSKALLRPDDLAGIVRHYRTEYQERAARELRFFRVQQTFEDAIEKAALAQRPDGKRFSHQRRIPRSALVSAWKRLQAVIAELEAASTFAHLFSIVDREIAGIPKIGKLMVYDTALRIAAWRQLEPEVVYLHAGTRDGAKALGLDTRRPYIAIADIPRALRRLRPHQIEDVLCIYKEVLKGQRVAPASVRCG